MTLRYTVKMMVNPHTAAAIRKIKDRIQVEGWVSAKIPPLSRPISVASNSMAWKSDTVRPEAISKKAGNQDRAVVIT